MSALPEVIDQTTTPQRPTQSELAKFEALGLAVLPLEAVERFRAAEEVCWRMLSWAPDQVYADPLEEHRRRHAVREALEHWYQLTRYTIERGEAIT